MLTHTTGDEVLEWNGRLLQGATFEDVYNIILESKPEPQVELVVSRPIGWVDLNTLHIYKFDCVCMLSHSVVSDSCDPKNWSPPDFSVHGIFQARILELPFPPPGYLLYPKIKLLSPVLAGEFFTTAPLGSHKVDYY